VTTAEVDVAVVGAGLVGLAVAREAAARGLSVAVLERNPRVAQETSSRHSGVLHAGLYYPTDSLKAQLCVEGRRELVTFCRRHDVPHRICGKLIVAASEAEEEGLERLAAQGESNGVEGLRRVTAAEVRAREPNVTAAAGLLSEATGIVSSDDLAAALQRRVEDLGGLVLLGQEVVGLASGAGGWSLSIRPRRGDIYTFAAGQVVNAAGLWAGDVARLGGDPDLRIHYCKGDYFWTTRLAVNGLVYPLPEAGLQGLGVHTTVDLAGRIRFGPDTTYVEALDYRVDEAKAPAFARAVSRYLGGLSADDLQPDTSGIRPKLTADGSFADFHIGRGPTGLLDLAGIESPGLTSCLAIGRRVADLLLS